MGTDSKATTGNGESLIRVKIIDAMHRDDYAYMVMGNAVERNDANGDACWDVTVENEHLDLENVQVIHEDTKSEIKYINLKL